MPFSLFLKKAAAGGKKTLQQTGDPRWPVTYEREVHSFFSCHFQSPPKLLQNMRVSGNEICDRCAGCMVTFLLGASIAAIMTHLDGLGSPGKEPEVVVPIGTNEGNAVEWS